MRFLHTKLQTLQMLEPEDQLINRNGKQRELHAMWNLFIKQDTGYSTYITIHHHIDELSLCNFITSTMLAQVVNITITFCSKERFWKSQHGIIHPPSLGYQAQEQYTKSKYLSYMLSQTGLVPAAFM